MASLTFIVNRLGLQLKKNAPRMLIHGGTIAMTAGAIWGCKKSIDLPELIDQMKDEVEDAKQRANTEGEYRKAVGSAYIRGFARIGKHMAGPATVFVAGAVGNEVGGHLFKKENAGLAAACAGLSSAFNQYRENVKKDGGAELDRKYRYGLQTVETEETTKDAKGNEKTKKVKTEIVVDDPSTYSDYARFFDESCKEWDPDPECNLTFLKIQQDLANKYLQANGHLFLNEVYDLLGIKRTKAGQYVGWVWQGDGDNFVDFGIYETRRERNRAFVNGYEPVILLDFNVDGVITDLI